MFFVELEHVPKNPIFPLSDYQKSPNHRNFGTNPKINSLNFPILTRSNSLRSRFNSLHPKSSSQNHAFFRTQQIRELLILIIFSLTLFFLRLFSNALLPNFPLRWRNLVAFSQQNEHKTRAYPSHLWQAIVAYEDKRFFSHFGVDPVGIGRAVLSFSVRGGGSTITQQVIVFYLYFFNFSFCAKCSMNLLNQIGFVYFGL